MLIVCPNCATSYQVIPDYLGESGRPVRCVTCHHVWFEEPRRPDVDPAAAFDEIWPPLQPLQTELPTEPEPDPQIWQAEQIWLEEHEAPATGVSHDSWLDLQESLERGGKSYSDPNHGLPDEAEPPALDAAAAEPCFVAPPPPVGPEISNVQPEVTTYIERLEDRRSFRRPIPARRSGSRRRVVSAKTVTPAIICILLLALAALVTARQQVVRHLPQTASLYGLLGMAVNLRGLHFGNIKTVSEVQDGVPVLVVEGDIIGTNARQTEVPRLRFAVIDRAGNEIYAWTSRPDRAVLPPGETLPFRSRLASPPAEASSVTVRFFDGHDATAELI